MSPMKNWLWLTVAMEVLLVTGSAIRAEPVPLSQAEMTRVADAVVIVDVVRVTRTAQRSHQNTPVFVACLCIREVRKGALHAGQSISWEMAQSEVAPGDSGGGLLYPGDQMLVYLQRQASGKYNTWRDDCTQWIRRPPQEQKCLPTEIGDSCYIR